MNACVRVLVADDNPELVLLYKAVLEDAGYEVVSASSGIAAINAAADAPIDAAVLDVLMPGVSGDAIAEQFKLEHPDLPVLLITGDYGEQFVTDSPVPVLHKPFAPEQLVDAVRRLLT
jgi:two-component system OmpR family response regulator